MTRNIASDQQTVWGLLTLSARLPEWLAPGMIEFKPCGALKRNFADSGTGTAFDAPRLIEYSWRSPGQPARPVRWEP